CCLYLLSLSEVKRVIDNVKSYKSQTVLMTIYSAGLRLSEAISLKIKDIDSSRMTIRVEVINPGNISSGQFNFQIVVSNQLNYVLGFV
ncbi:MAG: tyrosine-type recombinase/integrase, partial [Actinobacteria bacterium]|nr:tyrosine-type recombinase/integrase [Actinomycetota bacterium]